MSVKEQVISLLGYEYRTDNAEQEKRVDALIGLATNKACSITRHDALPHRFEPIVVEAVMIGYRQMGKEGVSSESVTNLSTHFRESMDDYLLKMLQKRKRP